MQKIYSSKMIQRGLLEIIVQSILEYRGSEEGHQRAEGCFLGATGLIQQIQRKRTLTGTETRRRQCCNAKQPKESEAPCVQSTHQPLR